MEKNHISLRSRFQNEIPSSFFNHTANSFEKELQDFNTPKKGMSSELEQKTRNCFVKLYKTLTHKNLTLYKIFLTYDIDRSGMLSIDEFGKILRRLDNSITEEEVTLVFNFIDTDGSKTIEFDELNNYYCKVNGIPLAMDLPPDYHYQKMQQQNPYYQQQQQMGQGSQGGGFVLNQLQNAFSSSGQSNRGGW